MKRKIDKDGVTLAAELTDDLTGRFVKEHLQSPDGEELVSFIHVVSKFPEGDYLVEYVRFGTEFEMVEDKEPPPEFKTVSWGSYLTFEDLREHQFSILDFGARAYGRKFRDINSYDGELLNKF